MKVLLVFVLCAACFLGGVMFGMYRCPALNGCSVIEALYSL